MPCAKLSVESSVLFVDGWGLADKCPGITKLWGADRHGKWGIGSVQLVPGATRGQFISELREVLVF